MASFKQLFSAAPVNSVEQLFTRPRIAFYSFIAFAPGTLLWIYVHNLKLEMESDNEAAKMMIMMKAQEEVLEEERKEAAILSQMQKVQANLQRLHTQMRSLEVTVTGKSTIEPLTDILPTPAETDGVEDASSSTDSIDDNGSLLATIKSTALQWWQDEEVQEQVDAWYKYLWEDDDLDDLFSLDAWKAKLQAWWNDEKPPVKLHVNAVLQTVEHWSTVDGSLSWMRNKDIVRTKIEEAVAEAQEARRLALEREAAAKREAELKLQRKIQAKLEKTGDKQSGIGERTSAVNATRVQKDFASYTKN